MTVDLSLDALFAGTRYAITGQFYGRDLLNGGYHQATDVGNFGMNDPVTSPIDGPARGLYHFDTAIGLEYDLGGGWTLQLWHLNETLAPLAMVPGRSATGPWQRVKRGQVCGRTGNTGARLPDGSPMPAHTHIELERGGVRYDAEAYLLGKPFSIGEDDMALPAFTPLATGVIAASTNIRAEASLDGAPYPLRATDRFDIVGIKPNGGRYSLDGGKTWRTDWLAVRREELRWCAAGLVSDVVLTDLGRALLQAALGDGATALENQVARARTAVGGAAQAIAVAQEALR